MNWLDFTTGVFLLIALINGYRKGLINQAIVLATVILSAVFGGKAAKMLLPEVTRLIDVAPNVAHVLSYVFAFIGIAIVISLIGRLIERFIEVIHLSSINRMLGSVLAVASTMVVLSIFLNLVLMLDTQENVIKSKTKEESFFFNRVEAVVPAIVPYLNKDVWEEYIPERYRKEVEKKYEV
ncbi:CvpA family protein [Limibacterium fermenti]|uniref:CvpA family protein n=1 Tax=Limibacterium fermenti TaxID=3229863 RepID=UPI000E8213B1|nr:hypothetical protein [Porphyromonadaceae bacterium]HBX44928.1 hypothetical protein [Porphyromonadaceae bacterium]